MPCTYEEPYETSARYLSELNATTRNLCTACGLLSDAGLDTRKVMGTDLYDWWTAHQEADRQREEKEKEQKKQKDLREKALSKLSPAELKALGLK